MTALQRGTGPAAVLAGGLWAAQGLIWTLGPAVQAVDPPYRITDRPLFALFWLAIVGAVLCSAAALLGLLHRGGDRPDRAARATGTSATAAGAALGTAGVAGIAVVVAALDVAEELGLAVLTPALNLAGLLLLVALSLAGSAVPRTGILTGRPAALPAVLAVLTLLSLGAIAAAASTAVIGLVFAVVVVTLLGATWALLGWALRPQSGR
ncbi:hypothetical protein [Pseudonocardia broussonetiae]|uniref:Uncharacterized protein n=1 Tax=Pseudonocardia broussonetiae TaxID=2736640 RepID=A0A6M6JKF6_9PSEU|nr:hypothetical protein [Pseudonocardia broussonetiae]QJY47427.1 hypothetical protein HOP40_17750 [Pseudonocardia broussonetiae]